MENPARPAVSRTSRTPAGRRSDQSRRKVATTNATIARASREKPSRAKRRRIAPRRRLRRAVTGASRSARGLTLADLHGDGLGAHGALPEIFRGGIAAGEHGAHVHSTLLVKEARVDGALENTWMSYVQAHEPVCSGPCLLDGHATRVERPAGAVDDEREELRDVAGRAQGPGRAGGGV